jgi:enoyl-[acyl-carrier-protein] reductase (NADH)
LLTDSKCWLFKEVAEAVKADYGSIDILVHSLANGPEVWSYLTDFLAVKRKYKKDAEHT